jgi:UPF0755 protein
MRRLLLRLSLLLIPLLLLASVAGYQLLGAPLAPPQAVSYRLQPGSSLSRVAEELEGAGVVRSALALKLLAKLAGQGGLVQSGTYRFSEPAPPGRILARLVAGDVEKVSLTIPEGFTLQQVIDRLAELGYGNRDRLRQLANDPEFVRQLGIEAPNLEGYLFPETYLFSPGISEAAVLKMLVMQFHLRVDQALLARAKTQQLNLHQLVTLASIIEKETSLVEEMPLIAAVFHNRLRRNIPLQTDPTVIYGLAAFDGNLTRKHLETPAPYNTYLVRGLPPGPIANPGLAALRAAAEPARSDYLYFVARGDGSHQFSVSLQEHNQAVRRFQLKRR